jgi:hypothetical protein
MAMAGQRSRQAPILTRRIMVSLAWPDQPLVSSTALAAGTGTS